MQIRQKTIFYSLILSSAVFISGCGDDDNLTAFNLIDITAANTSSADGSGEVRQMTLTWDRASSSADVEYTICAKDTSKENNCAALATVADVTEATIQLDSLLNAVSSTYFIMATQDGKTYLSSESSIEPELLSQMIGYFKASNAISGARFGYAAAMSADGYTFAIGSPYESSAAIGVGGNDQYSEGTSESSEVNYAKYSGAVYVFSYNAGRWQQSAYLKASNAQANDWFGVTLAMNADGTTLVVSANNESSDGTSEDNNEASKSGAAYVFSFDGNHWSQEAYLKASNADANDFFGGSVSISDDGSTIAVGATGEDSNATGAFKTVPEELESVSNSGAVYLFSKVDSAWSQTAYLKASNNDGAKPSDQFGYSVSLDGDGNTIVIGAPYEDSSAQGINGDGADNSATSTGAVYVFADEGSGWAQTAYIKAANSHPDYTDNFGHSVSINDAGSKLAVGAYQEDLAGTGVNPEITYEEDMTTPLETAGTGAVFIYDYADSQWSETAYIKASNAKENDKFGYRVALSQTGNTLAVSAFQENSSATGINNYLNVVLPDEDQGIAAVNYADNAGAVYMFTLTDSQWEETRYIKSSNTSEDFNFAQSIAINHDASVLVVGSHTETSATKNINGNQLSSAAMKDAQDNIVTDAVNYQENAGAVYLY